MSAFGHVRAVEVAPCNPNASSRERPAEATGSTSKSADFDVNALLENMPQPRALAKGKSEGSARGRGGSGLGNGSSSSSNLGGIDSAVGGVTVGLNVDAWVQFEGFRGFERALKGLRGRVMQHRNAELLCEYQLGVDVTGYMTHEQCREREIARAEEARKVRDSDELSCLKVQTAFSSKAGLCWGSSAGMSLVHILCHGNLCAIVEKIPLTSVAWGENRTLDLCARLLPVPISRCSKRLPNTLFVLLGWQEARRKNAIDKAKGQLVGLLEGLQGLQGLVDEDGRSALQEAVKPTMAKVHGSKTLAVVGNVLSI